MSRNPSWQHDLPTRAGAWAEAVLPLDRFVPSVAGTFAGNDGTFVLTPEEQRQVGIMLSLYLSDGSKNPVETFGTGTFPFDLAVSSIEIIIEERARK
mmetsp:Transcript_9654/g.24568  ORF Transcript_9654/g.24568 Transcript_9654/m.24568 type:complete len:97 (-) Transcript_9654:32-322(-)